MDERAAAAFKLLGDAGWRVDDFDPKALRVLYPQVQGGQREWAFAAVIDECSKLAAKLAGLINTGAVIEEGQPFAAYLDRETGKLEIVEFRPLGPYQDALERTLSHRRIDARRFARCSNEKCAGFYYKPRLSSRACSRKCEDVLISREFYWLEAGRRECALTLRSQGKSLFEIAHILGVKLKRVRQYLSNVEE